MAMKNGTIIKTHSVIDDLKNDILAGFSKPKKAVPSKYLYDVRGSELFNKITRHPDYYLTNCELEILRQYAPQMSAIIGSSPFNLIELGPGEGIKTSVLIKHFIAQSADFSYIPVDISAKYLEDFSENICRQHQKLNIYPIQGDYTSGLSWITKHHQARNVVLFLGSSIGNFDLVTAEKFLLQIRQSLRKNDLLLIGFDLKKDIPMLLKAYDDTDGITRAFNLNLLYRINTELGGEFNLDTFYHHATYNVYTGAMESYLISSIAQVVPINSLKQTISFDAFEAIHVEYSYKYLLPQIEKLAKSTGFEILSIFQDEKKYFVDSFWQVL